jgi:hypothetical protein
MSDSPYPPISDYALLSDCHSGALVDNVVVLTRTPDLGEIETAGLPRPAIVDLRP